MNTATNTLAILLLAVVGMARAADDNDGFTPLFNGKNLDGWEMKDDKPGKDEIWSVVDGVLVAKPGSNWLGTKQEFGDYILRLEWRVPRDGNSGVFVRVPLLKPGQLPYVRGIEIQVLDDDGPAHKGKIQPAQHSGSIYSVVAPSKQMFKGIGEWNKFEITSRGETLEVVYNGEKIATADTAKEPKLADRAKRGVIGLQNHGSAVEYRNVMIKVLDK